MDDTSQAADRAGRMGDERVSFSRLGGGRTTAETGMKPADPTLVYMAAMRVNESRQRVSDMRAMLGDIADNMLGTVPETDRSRAREQPPVAGAMGNLFDETDRSSAREQPPVAGAMGNLFDEIISLENIVGELESQVARFRGVA